MRTAIASHNNEPTWRKEEMIFPLDKGCSTSDGFPVCAYVEVFDMSTSMASTLMLTSSSNSLGQGRVDITPLLKGEEGHAVMDVWVELATKGKVHLIIEYEPNGEDPQVYNLDRAFNPSQKSRKHDSCQPHQDSPFLTRLLLIRSMMSFIWSHLLVNLDR